MTMRAFLAGFCLALFAALAGPHRAAAQEPSTFLVDSCALLPFCEGRRCPAGSRPIDLVTAGDGTTTCFCAPGASTMLGTPATCCRGTMCFPGSTCVDVADTDASLCVTPDMHCLGGAVGGSLPYDSVRACFLAPGTSTPQPYWGSGDCDGDGRPNGAEVGGGTDPCCNEVSDPAGCCLLGSADALACCALDADPVGCCVEQDVDPVTCCALDADPIGCCFEAGGEPATCCDGHDPVACCSAEADPRACCEAAGGTPEACCEVAADPLGCCLGTDAPDARCCARYGTPASPACAGIDASNVDAGVGVDGGSTGLDGGTAGGDGGNLGFGGGAGCRCAASRPGAPGPLALLGLLAIAIPAIRRRRR